MQIAQMQQEAAMQQQEAQNQTQGMRTEVSAAGCRAWICAVAEVPGSGEYV